MRSLVERDVIVDNLLDVVEDHRLRLRVLEENIQGVEQGVAGPHNLLSATHGDTVTAAVSRGALAYGSSTPAWAALAIGAAGTILRSDGTDVAWATLGTAGIAPNDAQYVVMTASGDLTVERVLSAGDGLTRTDGGAGNSVTLTVGAGTGIAVNANDVQLSHLGIESLTDPNDDRILFWDDGAGATAWLDPGSGPVISGTTLNVDHDACTNFVGDEHVAHSGVSITAGAGLTGGGTIAATRTIDVGAGTGIAVNANDVQLSHLGIESLTDPNDDRILFWDDGAGATAWLDPGSGPVISGTTLNVDHDACTNFAGDEHVAHSGVSITAGAGLTGGGTIAATRTIDVGAGDGITINANDVALTTPGTCTVATGNAAAGNHTHAITTSSSPGASASILASNASGLLRVVGLGIGANGAADWIIMADGAHIGQAAGPALEFDNTNDYLEITGCEVGIGTTAPDRLLHVEVSDAETSVVTYATRLTHVTSGTAAAGFGVGLEFELEENGGVSTVAGMVEVSWHAVGANDYTQMLFSTALDGTRQLRGVLVGSHNALVDGNARGEGATDFGIRDVVVAVASGGSSTISGGANNMADGQAATVGGGALCFASGDFSTVGGGDTIAANGDYSVVGGGSNNTANAEASSILGGHDNIAWNYGSTIGGGARNDTRADYATIPGGFYADADKYGQVVSAAGCFAAVGDAQGTIQMVSRRAVSTHVVDTWYGLYLDGVAGLQRMTIDASSGWTVYCSVIGITQNAAQQWGYEIIGLIERDNAGNTTLAAQTLRVIFESDANYTARLSADDANEALRVQVRRTGGVDYDVRWTATIRTSETTYP